MKLVDDKDIVKKVKETTNYEIKLSSAKILSDFNSVKEKENQRKKRVFTIASITTFGTLALGGALAAIIVVGLNNNGNNPGNITPINPVEFVGINEAMLRIEKATKKMTDKQKAMFLQYMFGTEAMSSINILFKEGIENLIEYGDNIDIADGKTREMARFMEAGFGGMKRSLESQKDGIMVVLGEIFEPVAWDFVKILRDGAAEVRETLEEEKSGLSLAASGLWSFTKKGAGLVGDFIYNTGEILDFATGGIFKAAPEAVVGGTANLLIEEGKEAQGLQEFERKKLQIEGSDSLMSMNEESLSKYLNKMYQTEGQQSLILPDIDKILEGTDFEDIKNKREFNINKPITNNKVTLEFDFKNVNGIFDSEEYREGIKELTLKTMEKQFWKVNSNY